LARVEAKSALAAGAGVGGADALRRFFRRYGWGYAFVLPSFITFLIFVLIPVVWAFIISLQDYGLSGARGWVGIDNYRAAFTTQSGVFSIAIRNTLLYTVVTVTTNIVVGLVLASLIRPLNNAAQTFFRAAYYLPTVISAVIIGVIWRWIYNTQWGLLNFLLHFIGLGPVRWLSDPDIAFDSVILQRMLTIPATAIILYSAAMGSIPRDLYEAADVDGAGALRKWWNITIPLIQPTTLFLVVLYTIASFEVFDLIYVLVPSGVGNSTQVVVTQIYQNGFVQFRYGVAAAQAFILFLMVAAVAAVQFRLLRSDVQY
jgi:multiple sugar transport system permease protein